jgi:hypothetical protein
MRLFQIGFRNRELLPIRSAICPFPTRRAPFSSLQPCPDLLYNGGSPDHFSPCDAMPSHRANLTLDEKSFQGLLAAAFTIQEHNDRRKLAGRRESNAAADPELGNICQHCGAPKAAEETHCPSCSLDEFRPGERLQRNWASMWLMSQEQGLWPERFPGNGKTAEQDVARPSITRAPRTQAVNSGGAAELALPADRAAAQGADAQEDSDYARDRVHAGVARTQFDLHGLAQDDLSQDELSQDELSQDELPQHDYAEDDLSLTLRSQSEVSQDDRAHDHAQGETQAESEPPLATNNYLGELEEQDTDLVAKLYRFAASAGSSGTLTTIKARSGSIYEFAANGRLVAAMQRLADWRVRLRFHRADLYLGTAIVVAAVALLWPAAGAPGKPATLGPFERVLVSLGIAEAPAPAVHLQGDPGIVVWIDPHTALYYCPGDAHYGTTSGGQLTSQRDAQMDRFEPAGRSVCE